MSQLGGGNPISPTLPQMEHVAAVVLAYFLGSIDFGVIVPRALGVDIYTTGSGNPGASNVFRTMGKKAAGFVLLGDAFKGFVAVGAVEFWIGGATTFAAGFAVVAGHVLPLFHRFRGGKGVATAIGAALWLEPIFGLLLAAGWVVVVLATKKASLASIGAALLYIPGFAIAGLRGASLLWTAAIAGLVLVRHQSNIRRLLAGREHRLEAL